MPAGSQLTALDWIAVALTAFIAVALCCQALVAPTFVSMYREMGPSPDHTLPWFCGIALSRWSGPSLAVVVLALAALGVRPQPSVGRRRALIVGAFCLGFLGSNAMVAAISYPIWAMGDLTAN